MALSAFVIMRAKTDLVVDRMNVSIYDVAKLAGVSISTVSRALNSSGYVSQKTRKKVMEAMEELRFVPSITAQNLAKEQTMLIGLYFPLLATGAGALSSVYFMEFIRGVNEVVMNKGYHLLLINETNKEKDLLEGVQTPQYSLFLKQKRIDGLLFGSAPLRNSSFLELVKSGSPMVYIGERQVSDRGLNVYALLKQNIWQSLDYLYERNHRNIMVLSASDLHIPGIVAAYREQKRDVRLQIDVWESNDDLDTYLDFISDVYRQEQWPTGLMIMDLSRVQPTINVLNNLGLRVPEDVSLITQEHRYSDGEHCFPAATSVYVPVYEMAREAAQLLFDYLEGNVEYNEQKLLTPRIIERQSVTMRTVPPLIDG